jgi:hypothetical protein
VAATLGWAGLAAVAASGLVLSDTTPFPGTAALLPTVGAALVIVAGFRPSFVLAPARLLGTAIPRYIGRISYSLYLWHWPLLVIPAAAAGAPLPLRERVALLGVAFVASVLSQRLIEDPIRHGRFVGVRPSRNLAMAGALTVSVAIFSLGLGMAAATPTMAATPSSAIASDEATVNKIIDTALADTSGGVGAAGLPATVDRPVPATLTPSLADARDDLPAPYTDGCHVDSTGVDSPPCTYGDVNGTHTVVLFGDSHAAQWWPALQTLSLRHGWRFISLTKSACEPIDLAQENFTLKRVYTECQTWRENTLARIAALHPDIVIVTGTYPTPLLPDGSAYSVADGLVAYRGSLARTLETLSRSAARVVLLGNTPMSHFDVPVCLSAHLNSILACATPVTQAFNRARHLAVEEAAKDAGVAYVDPTFWVCSSSPCPPVVGNILVYRDDQHMTPPFAVALAGRLGDALPGFPSSGATGGSPTPTPNRPPTPTPATMSDATSATLAEGRSRDTRTQR